MIKNSNSIRGFCRWDEKRELLSATDEHIFYPAHFRKTLKKVSEVVALQTEVKP
jgi:hypothetical protein